MSRVEQKANWNSAFSCSHFWKKKNIEHSYVHLCTIVFGFGCNCILTKRIDLFACLCSTSQQTNIHTIWLNGNFMRTQRAKQAGSEKKEPRESYDEIEMHIITRQYMERDNIDKWLYFFPGKMPSGCHVTFCSVFRFGSV